MDNRPDLDEGKSVKASFDTEVKLLEGESRSLNFTISSSRVDRSGDTIDQNGWHLDSYRKNPVVLWAHDSSMLPVGRAKSIAVMGDKLKATTEFTPAGMSRFNDTVFDMYKAGFLSATSVGFQPLKMKFAEGGDRPYGVDFLEQELLEFSAVPVPANADALVEARAAGIEIAPCLDWCLTQIKLFARDEDANHLIDFFKRGDPEAIAEAVVEANRIEKDARAEDRRRAYARRKRDLQLFSFKR